MIALVIFSKVVRPLYSHLLCRYFRQKMMHRMGKMTMSTMTTQMTRMTMQDPETMELDEQYIQDRVGDMLRYVRKQMGRFPKGRLALNANERLACDGGDYRYYINNMLYLKVYVYHDHNYQKVGAGYITYRYSGDNAIMTCFTDGGLLEHVAIVKHDQVELPCED